MLSAAASFRQPRTMCGDATRAASRPCAARTTSAMSDTLRLPFDDPDDNHVRMSDCGLLRNNRLQNDVNPRSAVLSPESAILNPESDMASPDRGARAYAVDPSQNVVLEASAGTGKTRVLVE